MIQSGAACRSGGQDQRDRSIIDTVRPLIAPDPASQSMTPINRLRLFLTEGAVSQVASATRFFLTASGPFQPSAGATVFAVSSIERRIWAWGGSTE
jgi:hypothetical protein